MQLPVHLSSAIVLATNSATANTQVLGTVIAAPGAGLILRLWAWSATHNTTTQAPGNWRASMTTAGGGTTFAHYSGTGFTGSPLLVIPGGIRWGTNNALGYAIADSVASTGIVLIAYYTTETA